MKPELFGCTEDKAFYQEAMLFVEENGLDALSRFLAENPKKLELFTEKLSLFASSLKAAPLFYLIVSSPSSLLWYVRDFGCDKVQKKLKDNEWTDKQKGDALRCFARENNEEAFSAILPFSDPLENSGWGSTTPLTSAIGGNAIEIVKTILNQVNPEQIGSFPLFHAVQCQHYELVKMLYEFTLPENRKELYAPAIGRENMDIIRFLSPNTKEEAEEKISKEWSLDPLNPHSIAARHRALSIYAEKDKAEIEQGTTPIPPSAHVNSIVRL